MTVDYITILEWFWNYLTHLSISSHTHFFVSISFAYKNVIRVRWTSLLPSVCIGEIGDQRAFTHDHDLHKHHPSMSPWGWRPLKETSRTSKARYITILANEGKEFGNCNNWKRIGKWGPVAKRLNQNEDPSDRVLENDNIELESLSSSSSGLCVGRWRSIP